MAGELQKIIRKYYDTLQTILASPLSDDRRSLLLAAAVTSLEKAYLGFFDKFYEQYVNSIFRGGQPYYGVSSWQNKHALDFAVWLIKTARNEPNTAFAQSHSITVTRTEVNAVGNLAALDAAYRSGARFKTWETFGDGKVRPSHKAVGGTRIPIDEPFTVGGSKMMFPTDSSLGADASEIVNCRCTLKFDNGKSLTNGNERDIIEQREKNDLTNQKGSDIMDLEKAPVNIPDAKFIHYALDPEKAPDKARAFELALGYTKGNYRDLIDNIMIHLDKKALKYKKTVCDGDLYEYVMALTGANGKTANVLTAWINDKVKGELRLTTAHVTDKKVTKNDKP